jgi:hypothetical protein
MSWLTQLVGSPNAKILVARCAGSG